MLIGSSGGAATTDRTQHRGQNTDAPCLSYVSCHSDRLSSCHNDEHAVRVYSVRYPPSPSKLLQIAGLACLLVRGFVYAAVRREELGRAGVVPKTMHAAHCRVDERDYKRSDYRRI